MMSCIENTDAFENIHKLGKDIELFSFIFDKDKDKDEMNIFQFLFVKRLNLAWGECASGGPSLSMADIPCAMRIMVPNMIADIQESKMIL